MILGVVDGTTHTNLIFDVVVPHQFHLKDEQIADTIRTKVRELYGNYFAVINVEHSMVRPI